MIRVSIGLLEKQKQELEGEEPADFLDIGTGTGMDPVSPFRYRLTAEMVSGSVLVRGEFSYDIAGICGRCLEPVTQTVSSRDLALYFDHPLVEELDISPEIREEALLELPINLLCSDDCAGLCRHCGCNLNHADCDCVDDNDDTAADDDRPDPWAALDQLKI
ncbi:MAG: DUF177 domain-containing protein [Lentisphaeria bacterium]|nr:DUF177 domain-containing protein [Lentisphaeria bacterium]